jgi:hypothetical protein
MPHFKCLACTTRLYSTEGQADPIGDLCPVWVLGGRLRIDMSRFERRG